MSKPIIINQDNALEIIQDCIKELKKPRPQPICQYCEKTPAMGLTAIGWRCEECFRDKK